MPDQDRAQTAYELAELPEESTLRSVTAVPADIAGRRALRVELTDEVTLQGKAGVDSVDMPTFVIIPADFKNGTIEVDILSRLNGKGPANARAFAGVAYRITDGGDHFEAVYLRPLNGLKTNSPSPRDKRVSSSPSSPSIPNPTTARSSKTPAAAGFSSPRPRTACCSRRPRSPSTTAAGSA